MSYVYCIRNSKSGKIKIGKGNNPRRRLQTLQTGNADILILEGTIETDNPFKIEKILHRMFDAFRQGGEWFELSEKDNRLLQAIFKTVEATENEAESFRRLGLW
jgi:hypothetical protein